MLLYSGALMCGTGSGCLMREHVATTLLDTTTGQESYVGPNARISRNGRYLAAYSSPGLFGSFFTLTDRASGLVLYQSPASPSFTPPTAGSIAADGTMAVVVGSTLQLVRGGVQTKLPVGATNATIDDAATKIVYEAGRRLFVLDSRRSLANNWGPTIVTPSRQHSARTASAWHTFPQLERRHKSCSAGSMGAPGSNSRPGMTESSKQPFPVTAARSLLLPGMVRCCASILPQALRPRWWDSLQPSVPLVMSRRVRSIHCKAPVCRTRPSESPAYWRRLWAGRLRQSGFRSLGKLRQACRALPFRKAARHISTTPFHTSSTPSCRKPSRWLLQPG